MEVQKWKKLILFLISFGFICSHLLRNSHFFRWQSWMLIPCEVGDRNPQFPPTAYKCSSGTLPGRKWHLNHMNMLAKEGKDDSWDNPKTEKVKWSLMTWFCFQRQRLMNCHVSKCGMKKCGQTQFALLTVLPSCFTSCWGKLKLTQPLCNCMGLS